MFLPPFVQSARMLPCRRNADRGTCQTPRRRTAIIVAAGVVVALMLLSWANSGPSHRRYLGRRKRPASASLRATSGSSSSSARTSATTGHDEPHFAVGTPVRNSTDPRCQQRLPGYGRLFPGPRGATPGRHRAGRGHVPARGDGRPANNQNLQARRTGSLDTTTKPFAKTGETQVVAKSRQQRTWLAPSPAHIGTTRGQHDHGGHSSPVRVKVVAAVSPSKNAAASPERHQATMPALVVGPVCSAMALQSQPHSQLRTAGRARARGAKRDNATYDLTRGARPTRDLVPDRHRKPAAHGHCSVQSTPFRRPTHRRRLERLLGEPAAPSCRHRS